LVRGKGLLRGLLITGKHLFGKPVTQLYPEQEPILPARFRGPINVDKEKCNACELCVKSCPVQAISLEAEKLDKKKILKKYEVDPSICMHCNLCVESCPKDALENKPEFARATLHKPKVENRIRRH